jgi:hypothetical protein
MKRANVVHCDGVSGKLTLAGAGVLFVYLRKAFLEDRYPTDGYDKHTANQPYKEHPLNYFGG